MNGQYNVGKHRVKSSISVYALKPFNINVIRFQLFEVSQNILIGNKFYITGVHQGLIDATGIDYFATEAVFLIIKEWLTYLVGGATSSFGIGVFILAASTFYLTPVGIINAYDRALKTNRARTDNADERRDEDKQKKKKKKKKRKSKAARHDDVRNTPKHKILVMAY